MTSDHSDEPPLTFEERLRERGFIPAKVEPRATPQQSVIRDSTALSAYLQAAVNGEVTRLVNTTEGSRNHTLNAAAFSLGQLIAGAGLDEPTVIEALTAAAQAAGLEASETAATIRSGIRAGKDTPRAVPEPETTTYTPLDPFDTNIPRTGREGRTVALTSAATIKVRPVKWLWTDKIALGTLALLAGREGIGKSTVAYDIAGAITRGVLPGCYHGQPRAVIVAATEDSWEHTIVPRLMAAEANLHLVYRVDVTTNEGIDTTLSLPKDVQALEAATLDVGASLILLDPLMSRLDADLDSHKDAEVRQALEPITAIADRTRAACIGLIHLNKSSGTDPLTLIMGSRAFAAVARAVLFAMIDPDDASNRLLGQPKNNLGRDDLPTLTYTIESKTVAQTDEGPVTTGRIRWGEETARTVRDVLESAGDTEEERFEAGSAARWLYDYLLSQGGEDNSTTIKAVGKAAGHSNSSLDRARKKVGAKFTEGGFPRTTFWKLPDFTIDDSARAGGCLM